MVIQLKAVARTLSTGTVLHLLISDRRRHRPPLHCNALHGHVNGPSSCNRNGRDVDNALRIHTHKLHRLQNNIYMPHRGHTCSLICCAAATPAHELCICTRVYARV